MMPLFAPGSAICEFLYLRDCSPGCLKFMGIWVLTVTLRARVRNARSCCGFELWSIHFCVLLDPMHTEHHETSHGAVVCSISKP